MSLQGELAYLEDFLVKENHMFLMREGETGMEENRDGLSGV
jgi:hypothetical protein